MSHACAVRAHSDPRQAMQALHSHMSLVVYICHSTLRASDPAFAPEAQRYVLEYDLLRLHLLDPLVLGVLLLVLGEVRDVLRVREVLLLGVLVVELLEVVDLVLVLVVAVVAGPELLSASACLVKLIADRHGGKEKHTPKSGRRMPCASLRRNSSFSTIPFLFSSYMAMTFPTTSCFFVSARFLLLSSSRPYSRRTSSGVQPPEESKSWRRKKAPAL